MKIKNKDLNSVITFLKDVIKASKMDSVHRMRVVKKLEAQVERLISEEAELVKEFVVLDEDGKMKQNEGGGFYVNDKDEFENQHQQLMEEEFSIEHTNLGDALRTIKGLVENYEDELSGESAEAHYILVEALEDVENGDGY